MNPSRFERSEQKFGDSLLLEYRARVDSFRPEPAMTVLDEPTLEQLAHLAGTPEDSAAPDLRKAFVFSNGWQSWSPGWELAPGERVERARFIRRLNIYTDHPALRPARGEVLASFLGYARSGRDYLALASLPEETPPASFLFRRKKGTVSIQVYAEGARFKAGELAARVLVVFRNGYFELKDALKEAYGRYNLFERLNFLAPPGGPLVPGGYESWYNHYADINESLILADLASIKGNGNLIDRLYIQPGKPTVFQVDDGWEKSVGDWRVNEDRFPRGMAEIALRIEEAGHIPGIWLAPFLVTRFAPLYTEHPDWLLKDEAGKPVAAGWMPNWGYDFYCLDLSQPDVLDYLYSLFYRVVNEWGFRYLKLDFLYAGMLRGVRGRGGAAFEHYRAALKRLTSITTRKDGKPVAYLGCGAPFESSFEFLPLMRIGADTREEWEHGQLKFLRHPGRPSARMSMMDILGRALWDGTVFVNDPDVVFCRSRRMRLAEPEKELVALTARMFASQVMFSDDPADFDPETEGAFTARIAEFYEKIGGRHFAPERVHGLRDVFTARGRNGRLSCVINLSESDAFVPGDWPGGRALLAHFRPEKGGAVFERHSVSLFERD